jgi:hypothetical protein
VAIEAEKDIGVLIFTLEKMRTMFDTCLVNGDTNEFVRKVARFVRISFVLTSFVFTI